MAVARKSSTPPPTRQQWSDGFKFVRCDLSDEQLAACKAWSPKPDEIWEQVEYLVQRNYKLSVKYDDRGRCVSAFLSSFNGPVGNGNQTLSGRGSTAFKAVKQLLYKHFHVLDGMWPEGEEGNKFKPIDD